MAAPTDAEIEQLALRAFSELPGEFRDRVTNLAFVVEDEPPPGKPWLATYQGVPLTKQSVFCGGASRAPLLRLCGEDREELKRSCGTSCATRLRTTSGSATRD